MPEKLGSPERIAGRLAGRLKRHLWWDTLLVLFPPLFAVTSLGFLPYGAAWRPGVAWIGVGALLAASAFLIGLWRARGAAASLLVRRSRARGGGQAGIDRGAGAWTRARALRACARPRHTAHSHSRRCRRARGGACATRRAQRPGGARGAVGSGDRRVRDRAHRSVDTRGRATACLGDRFRR